MKVRSTFLKKSAGLLATAAVRAWMSTLTYKVAYYDPSVDPARPEYDGRKIYIFWHEYILIPLYLRGHNDLAMLLSRHSDAEILACAAYHMGFDVVRGSTSSASGWGRKHGGATAVREMQRKSHGMNLTITPDGPRGPRRRMAKGPIYLASRLGMPLVLMGFGMDKPWRMRSWDRFAVPRPGTRARAVVSPPIRIPPKLGRDGVEHYRREMQKLLTRLTQEAEAWAEAGTPKLMQQFLRREPSRSHLRRDAAHAVRIPHVAQGLSDAVRAA